MIEVPNHSQTEIFDIAVGGFGRTDLDLKFNNGVLVEANQTRDSELATLAKIPFEAMKAFGEAVAQVIQIRIDQTEKETSLSQKELELLNANEALKEAQENIIEANDIE